MSDLVSAAGYTPNALGVDEKPFLAIGPKPRVIRIHGWQVIFSLATVLTLVTAGECRSITHFPSLLYGAVLWVWWGFVANAIWQLGQRSPIALRFSPRIISLHLLAAVILGVLHLLFLGGLGFTVPGWAAHSSAPAIWTRLFDINRFGFEILVYGFVFGIAGIVQMHVQAQRETMHSLELQRQLSAAHLQALQMQLEPHFLFNTLNAITTLVELGRQKEAAEMLSHLNAVLKSTLQRTSPGKVPLWQELEILENYLAIEQVRFADRLSIEIKVDPSALDGLVPCFLLQPIVENAVRHGIAQLEENGVIQTSIEREGGYLHLRVRDNGPGSNGSAPPGHGIGLRNTQHRLTHFYQKRYELRVSEPESGGFEVSITLPYEPKLS